MVEASCGEVVLARKWGRNEKRPPTEAEGRCVKQDSDATPRVVSPQPKYTLSHGAAAASKDVASVTRSDPKPLSHTHAVKARCPDRRDLLV